MIIVKNLTMQYANDAPCIFDLNLNLIPGQVCTLVGKNGSGKSTLLKILARQITPLSGDILLEEKILQISDVLYLSQNLSNNIIPQMSLLDNALLLNKENHPFAFCKKGTIRLNMLNKLMSFISELQSFMSNAGLQSQFFTDTENQALNPLHELFHAPLMQFSGGEQQLLACVLLFINNGKLLLLDEATSALDVKKTKAINRYVAHKIKSNYLHSLIVSHDLKSVIEISDVIFVLSEDKSIIRIEKDDISTLNVDKLENLMHQGVLS